MMYVCVGCGKEKKVTASVSKPRAVCICEPCMRASLDPVELDKLLHPTG